MNDVKGLAGGNSQRWRWLVAAFLILPPVILFWEIVFGGRVIFWGAPLLQFGPWFKAAVDAVRGGEWPLWNPWVGNGSPLLANYQVAPFYPPNWLHLVLPVGQAMSLSMVLHVIWAGAGTWFYAREIELSPMSRLISAVSFMLSGYLVSRLGFISIGSTLPWLPWLFWASERLVKKTKGGSALMLGLILGVQWLAGHAQTAFYSGIAVGFYLLWRLVVNLMDPSRPREERRIGLLFPTVIWFAGAVLIASGIAAIQLLPTAEYHLVSQRSTGVLAAQALTYSLWPFRVISFFTPRFFGHPATNNYWGFCCNYWEDNGYVGLLTLLLAVVVVALWLRSQISRRRRQPETGWENGSGPHNKPAELLGPIKWSLVPFFALLALISLVLSFGIHTPIYPWIFEHIPGFGQFQAPARLLCLWTWGVSILGGFGAHLWPGKGHRQGPARYAIVIGTSLLISALASSRFLAGKTITFSLGIGQLGFSLLIIGVLDLARPRRQDLKREFRWAMVVLVFVTIDLIASQWGAIPTAESWLYTRQTQSGNKLKDQTITGRMFYLQDQEYRTLYTCHDDRPSCRRFLSFSQFGPRDTSYWFELRETLLPDMGILDGIPSANNYDPLLVSRYKQLVDEVNNSRGEQRETLLQTMGVGVIVSQDPFENRKVVHSNQDVFFSSVSDPMPRVYTTTNIQLVGSPEQAIKALSDPAFDPKVTTILEPSPAGHRPILAGSNLASGTDELAMEVPALLTSTCNSVTIRTVMPQKGYLVLLDTFYPDWEAVVDGALVPIFPANLAFRAVELDQGEHLVEFRYRPSSFRLGSWISLVTIVLLVVFSAGRMFDFFTKE